MVESDQTSVINLAALPGDGPSVCGVIIGATKCGTTSLYRALAAHPNICPSNRKELNVFLEAETSPRNAGEYLANFRFNPLIHRVTLEASPQYTHYPRFQDVAKRMKACGAPFRLVYVVRDPYERLESHYRNGLGEGFLDAGPDEWLDEYGVMASDYAAQLAHFEACFAPEDILVLSFDLTVNDPGMAHDLVCRHLGVPAGRYLPQRWENRGEAFLEERAKLAASNEPRVSAARKEALIPERMRSQLKRRWAPGMTAIAQRYGVDVSRWGFPVRVSPDAIDQSDDRMSSRAGVNASKPSILDIDCPAEWRPEASEELLEGLKKTWAEAREHWASGDLVSGRLYGKRAERIPNAKFSLVIATHERTDLLDGLLKRLRSLVRQRLAHTEIYVVIDGDPAVRYEALASRYSDIAVFARLTENRGPGTARNVGAAMASGDFLVFLDDDCQLDETHFDHLMERLKTYPNITAMGGPTVGIAGRKRDFYERFTLTAGINPKPGYHNGQLICLPSCNLAVRRDWFLAECGFDPRLRASEDYNLTYRLKQKGGLLHDDAGWSVGHEQNWGLKGILKRARRDGYWLSAHTQLENDSVSRSILPETGVSALWDEIPKALKWRERSWSHLPDKERSAFLRVEYLRQVWIWRGARQWQREHKSKLGLGAAQPAFEPDAF